MALAIYNFHRVLILAATGFFGLLCAYGFYRFSAEAKEKSLTFADGLGAFNSNLILALAAAVAAVAGGIYFAYFNAKLARIRRGSGE